ncbi:MAG: HPP family protein [Nanoarchaeota archaeon]
MAWHEFITKEKRLWHEHFIPSFIAGLAVALLAFIFQITVANIVLFASVGSSAIILTHAHHHHLTKLRTTIAAYLIAIIFSMSIYIINMYMPLSLPVSMFILIFCVAMLMYLLDTFHPPAITASLSFLLLERRAVDLIYLFVAIIAMFIMVRLITYVLSQNLPIQKFFQEFVKKPRT